MIYNKTLLVPLEELKTIQQLLKTGKDSNGAWTEDDIKVYTVEFDNGYFADIKVCGADEDLPWTEMVLFNKNGGECCCTDCSDEFDGEWELEYNGDVYRILVTEK